MFLHDFDHDFISNCEIEPKYYFSFRSPMKNSLLDLFYEHVFPNASDVTK